MDDVYFWGRDSLVICIQFCAYIYESLRCEFCLAHQRFVLQTGMFGLFFDDVGEGVWQSCPLACAFTGWVIAPSIDRGFLAKERVRLNPNSDDKSRTARMSGVVTWRRPHGASGVRYNVALSSLASPTAGCQNCQGRKSQGCVALDIPTGLAGSWALIWSRIQNAGAVVVVS